MARSIINPFSRIHSDSARNDVMLTTHYLIFPLWTFFSVRVIYAQLVFYNLLNVAAIFVALILNKYWHNLNKSPAWSDSNYTYKVDSNILLTVIVLHRDI